MATQIQRLFLIQASIVLTTMEDLAEGVAWYENDGTTPILLDGISFVTVARTSRDSLAPYLALASAGVSLGVSSDTPRGLMLATGNRLAFYAPLPKLPRRPMAGTFVFDTLAIADGLVRRVVDGELRILPGT